jgi:hypothetical protein
LAYRDRHPVGSDIVTLAVDFLIAEFDVDG